MSWPPLFRRCASPLYQQLSRRGSLLALACLLGLSAAFWPSSRQGSASAPALRPALTATPFTPGLQLSGSVRLESTAGPGLGDVRIYRAFAPYRGEHVATTNPAGLYDTGFSGIPGEEWVMVWGEAAGYTIEPQQYLWRHYFGREVRELHFVARPLETSCPDPAPTPARLLVIRTESTAYTTTTPLQISLAAGSGADTQMALLTLISTASEGRSISTTAVLSGSAPLSVDTPLLLNARNFVTVAAQIEDSRDCSYTTQTAYDWQGLPLEILQLNQRAYLPLAGR